MAEGPARGAATGVRVGPPRFGACRLAIPSLAEVSSAVLREVQTVVPFAFGVVLRLEDDHATVAGLYPGGMAGIEAGVEWSPLDGAERLLLRLGEPSLDAMLRGEPAYRSPLVRLPTYGLRAALRVPLFHAGAVAGSAAIYAYEPGGFGPREGIAFEQYVRALDARLAAPRAEGALSTGPSPGAPRVSAEPPSASATETPSTMAERPAPAPPPPPTPPPAVPEPERLFVLGELVSGVAHELNNPLTTILGYAQLLPTLAGDDARHAMTTIEQEAQRAGRIVRNLLYFARQHRPRVEPVDLNAVLRAVIDVRRYALEANNIRLDVHLGAVPELVGDQYQLEQVFLNLLMNAQQALPDGGVITIESSAAGDMARVSVTDTGPGIPGAIASRIFEPFFTTREVGEGEGLGLSTAYGIVQAHGGRLGAERAPQGGARFVVELPVPPEARAPAASAVESDQRGRGERVLVVEDEAAVRALVAAILGASGYAVHAVASATEALQALAAGSYDLVVTGVSTSGVGGETLIEQVNARWPSLRSRLLFISGDLERNGVPSLRGQGELRSLEQPFTAAQLLGAVRAVLDAAGR